MEAFIASTTDWLRSVFNAVHQAASTHTTAQPTLQQFLQLVNDLQPVVLAGVEMIQLHGDEGTQAMVTKFREIHEVLQDTCNALVILYTTPPNNIEQRQLDVLVNIGRALDLKYKQLYEIIQKLKQTPPKLSPDAVINKLKSALDLMNHISSTLTDTQLPYSPHVDAALDKLYSLLVQSKKTTEEFPESQPVLASLASNIERILEILKDLLNLLSYIQQALWRDPNIVEGSDVWRHVSTIPKIHNALNNAIDQLERALKETQQAPPPYFQSEPKSPALPPAPVKTTDLFGRPDMPFLPKPVSPAVQPSPPPQRPRTVTPPPPPVQQQQVIDEGYKQWTVDDVNGWLYSMDMGEQTIEAFYRRKISGRSLPGLASEQALIQLGVQAQGDRLQLIEAIQQLDPTAAMDVPQHVEPPSPAQPQPPFYNDNDEGSSELNKQQTIGYVSYSYTANSKEELTVMENELVEIVGDEGGFYKVYRPSDQAVGYVLKQCIHILANELDDEPMDGSGGPSRSSSSGNLAQSEPKGSLKSIFDPVQPEPIQREPVQPDPNPPKNLTSFVARWEAAAGPAGVSRCKDNKERQRQIAIFELLETWNAFVLELDEMANKIMQPLRALQIFTPEELTDLFGNLDDIREISLQLANDLHQRVVVESKYVVTKLADILSARFKTFHAYAAYCSNVSRANAVLQGKIKNPAYVQFLERIHMIPSDLASMLMKPFQRVMKLELQVKEIIRGTPESGRNEHWDLRLAQAAIEDICLNINHVQTVTTDLVKKEYRGSLMDPLFLATSRRKLLFFGEVNVVSAGVKEPLHYALLYDDCLILAHLKKEEQRMFTFKANKKMNSYYRLKLQPLFLEMLTLNRDQEKVTLQLNHTITKEVFILSTAEVVKTVAWQHRLITAKDAKVRSRVYSLQDVAPLPRPNAYACVECDFGNHNLVMLLGTDNNLFIKRPNENWIQQAAQKRSAKITQIGFIGALIITLDSNNVTSYQDIARAGTVLDTSGHHPIVFDIYDQELFVLTSSFIMVYYLINPQTIQLKRQYSVPSGARINVINDFIILGAGEKFYRLHRSSASVDEIKTPGDLPSSIPLMALRVGPRQVLLCFQHYGLLYSDDLNDYITRVFWSKASSISFLHPHLLVAHADEHYIEVRDVNCIWPIVQILPCRNPLLCTGFDGLVITEDDNHQRFLKRLQRII